MGENDNSIFYKRKIVEIVSECNNERFLKFLYDTILSFKKKWGI